MLTFYRQDAILRKRKRKGKVQRQMQEQPQNQSDGPNTGDASSAEQHQIASAINSLKRSYDANDAKRGTHDRETLEWARRTAKAAIFYTVLTTLLLGAGIWIIDADGLAAGNVSLYREGNDTDQDP